MSASLLLSGRYLAIATSLKGQNRQVDRAGAPTHPVPVIRDIGVPNSVRGTRKFAATA
jgi:hypothetical protein